MAIISKPDMTYLWASEGAVIAPSPSKVKTGWTAEIPPHQWENWVQNRQDQSLGYLFQRGIAEWDATTEYSANGSYVQWNGKTYKAIANSINVLPSNTSSWKVWGLELDDLPSATTTTKGVIEVATDPETIAGTDTARAVTPAGLSSRTALESRTGLVQLSTAAEAQALTNDTKALTPKKLGDAMNAHVLGMGQTWQDVIASRALGTTYTNTTGRPIYVFVTLLSSATNTSVTINVDGLLFAQSNANTNLSNSIGAIVPNGATYQVSAVNGSLIRFLELR